VNYHLFVVHEFGPYKKGHKITAPDEVAMVLASPQHPHVVKVAAPVTPEPEQDA
jgi:hypothetical protein